MVAILVHRGLEEQRRFVPLMLEDL